MIHITGGWVMMEGIRLAIFLNSLESDLQTAIITHRSHRFDCSKEVG